jgi:hypothetical protein
VKKKTVKGKSGWLLLYCPAIEGEDPQVLYDGPDRATARTKAEKALAGGAPSISVFKVTRRTSLTQHALVSSLPRESF